MLTWPSPAVPELPGQGIAPRVRDTTTNTLVEPVTAGEPASIYVCGITPYDATHLGHAATYIAFDLLIRAWLDAGSPVDYAQNVTDVDDPLLERAAATGVDWRDLARREERLFLDDMTALRVLPPRHFLSVTEHMAGIIDWVELLIADDLAYQVETDWYFDTSAGDIDLAAAQSLTSDPVAVFAQRGGDPDRPGKRAPLDPLLWRSERPGEPSWPAPFGAGRPGWHVECLAIARDTLGHDIAVQGGGSDLAFPHHFMCELQGRAATATVFAKAHVHAGMVGLDGQKMSKSLGNLVLVSKLLAAGRDPMAVRLAILGHHYQSDWFWESADLVAAEGRLVKWREALSGPGGPDPMPLLAEVRWAMADNLDAPRALSLVDNWVAAVKAGDTSVPNAPGLVARMLDALLGLAL